MSDQTFHWYLTSDSDSGGKFWEVLVQGNDLNIRYGKVGQEKAWTTKSFGSFALAIAEGIKKMNAKLRKGYVQCDEVPAPGEMPAAPAARELDDLFGELRSLLEGKQSSAAAKSIQKLYATCWKQDRTRTEEELDAYLFDKLASWPASYFAVKVKQKGLQDKWPKAAQPLKDIKKLGDAPEARLTKEFKHLFDGNYMPSDDAELTPYLEKYWVGKPIDFASFVQNPIVQRLESLYFDFDQISEYQSYSNLIYGADIQLFLFNMPKLKHLMLVDSWQTRGFGPSFLDERVQCKLESFGSWESGFKQGDLEAMSRAESLSELKWLRAGFGGYGGRASWVKGEIEALANSEHIKKLERFDLNTDDYNDASLAEMLTTSENFGGLEELSLYIPGNFSEEFLQTLAQKDPANGLKLEILRIPNLGADVLDTLDALEQVNWKTLVIPERSHRWDATQLDRLRAIGKGKKFKIKTEKVSYTKKL